MSTLNVSNIQSTGSGFNDVVSFKNSSGTQNGFLCRAWVNFNGSGTVAIRDDFNVTSITDSGVGLYQVNMSNALSNTNYAVTAGSSHLSGTYLSWPHLRDRDQVTRSTTQFQLDCKNSSGSATDQQEIHIAVFGD
jgi:hypothetical protein